MAEFKKYVIYNNGDPDHVVGFVSMNEEFPLEDFVNLKAFFINKNIDHFDLQQERAMQPVPPSENVGTPLPFSEHGTFFGKGSRIDFDFLGKLFRRKKD